MPAGTISVTNNSSTVTGTDTTFLNDFDIGDYIGFTISNISYSLPVTAIASDISLTLADTFGGPTTSELSYTIIPQSQLLPIPAQLVNATAQALRENQQDRENWNQLLTVDGDVTITNPDGTTFTGPSWLKVAEGINLSDLEQVTEIAQEIQQSVDAVATSASNASASALAASNSESAAATSETNAATSESNAASSANEAAQSASSISDSVDNAAKSASDAADSASAAATSESNSATSATNAADSATAAAASEQGVTDSADAAANSEANAAASASAALNSQNAAATSETNSATSETNAAASASSAADDAETANNSIQQTLTNAQTAQDQADRATTEADRAETEADKLGNINDFASILDTIDIDNADVTFKGNVAGSDAVDSNDFVTLSQLNISTSQNPLNANTFDELASVVPAEAGHLCFLREYTSGTGYGGGLFIAVSGSGTSDGGLTQAINDDFHWRRYVDPAQAEITMFGAVPDGETDCIDAVEKMFNWSRNSGDILQRIGVQLPAGEFVMSSMEAITDQLVSFRFVGLGSERYGYNNPTRIKLIGEADSICFDIISRWVEIGNIQLQGIAPGETDTVVRHFLKNSITQGQEIRVSNMYVLDMGGKVFQLLDTLDAKFDQIYGSRGHDNFLRVLASGESSWDHSTAIEISNSTFQSYVADSDQQGLLFIPNCTQAMMWNVWIEFCDYPGNITLGEWALHSVAMESNDNPLYASQCRLAQYSCSNANGAGVDISTDMTVNAVTGEYETRTLSAYESGQVAIYSHGIYANASLKSSLNYTGKIYSNLTSASVWIQLGLFVGGNTAETYRIQCVTRSGFSTPVSSTGGLDGDAVITIQNRSSLSNTVTWNAQRNSSGILAVRYVKPFTSDTTVYVQLAPFSRLGVNAISTGTTRVDAGEHSNVQWKMTVISDDDLNAIDGLLTPISTNSWGTVTSGIVADGDNNQLGFYTSTTNSGAIRTMNVLINGSSAFIPYLTDNNFISLGHSEIADLPSAADNPWKVRFTRGFTVTNSDSTTTTYPAGLVYSNGNAWFLINGEQISVTGAAT